MAFSRHIFPLSITLAAVFCAAAGALAQQPQISDAFAVPSLTAPAPVPEGAGTPLFPAASTPAFDLNTPIQLMPQNLTPPPPPAPAPAALPAGDSIDLRFANGIVAVVEDKPITVDDVRLEIAPLLPEIQRRATSQQDFENQLKMLQDDIIQGHIDRTLIVKEFYREKEGEQGKRSIPASYIDNHLSEVIVSNFDNDRSKFLAYLRAKGQTIREYRKELEEEMINNYMRLQQRKNANVVSPVKVQTFYDENKDKFYQEDQVHLRLIQFNRDGQTDDELRVKTNEVLNRLKNGEKFDDIAKEVSQDTRRSKGGDWGWQKRTDLKPELSGPLFELKKGEITNPVFMAEGAFLMYVQDRKYAGIQTIDEVRELIENLILQQMLRASQEQWLERLRRDGYVKYYELN